MPKIITVGNLRENNKITQSKTVYMPDGLCPTLQAAMGTAGNCMPFIVEVKMCEVVIGSMQKHAFIGNGDYCPSLTEAMGKGGGQIPMMLEMKKINEENFIVQKCGDRDKEGNYSVHDYSNCIPANPE